MAGLNYGNRFTKQDIDIEDKNKEGVFLSPKSKKWVVRMWGKQQMCSIAQYEKKEDAIKKYLELTTKPTV